MRFGLATRITLTLALILASGVVMTTALSVHMFERTLADVLSSRFEFVLNEIRQRIETQMDLGLTLPVLQGVPEELEKHLRADEQLLSIEVFDETGIVLFSTDPSFVGDLVAEEWILAWRTTRADGKAWSDQERDSRVVGGAVARQPRAGRGLGRASLLPELLQRRRDLPGVAPPDHRRSGGAGHGSVEHPRRHFPAAPPA